jgi:phenylacetate-CoA ligase
MEKSHWLELEQIEVLQVENLRRFLSSTEQHVPCYRELFAKLDFVPSDVTCLEDIQKLPLTDKSFIRTNLEQLKANNAVGLSRFNTGGSSGEPLIFYIGKERVSHDVAAKWRATRWWGVDIGDPEIVVWGSPIELGTQDKVRQFRDAILRTRLLPAFEMSKEKLDSFIKAIRSVRPKMLFGYPSALALIASHAKHQGVRMDDLDIKVAFVTSERLYDHQQEKIQTVFGCPVANGYGGRDAGFIAHQCAEGGMHITAEDIIVEIVDQEGNVLPKGESGEIVVTHLATQEFPFIRYRTGDVGALSTEICSCGRGLPLLKEIHGRSTDFLIAYDGTILHGLAVIYVLRDLAGVKEFKIIQESIDTTRVQIVKDDAYQPNFDLIIQSEFKKRLGEKVGIYIEYKTEIKAEKSGKYRYVVSEVDIPVE